MRKHVFAGPGYRHAQIGREANHGDIRADPVEIVAGRLRETPHAALSLNTLKNAGGALGLLVPSHPAGHQVVGVGRRVQLGRARPGLPPEACAAGHVCIEGSVSLENAATFGAVGVQYLGK